MKLRHTIISILYPSQIKSLHLGGVGLRVWQGVTRRNSCFIATSYSVFRRAKIRAIKVIIWFVMGIFSPMFVLADTEAEQLLNKVRSQQTGTTMVSDYQVRIVRPDWQRVIKFHLEQDNQQQHYQAEVTQPRKLAGTQFIKTDGQLRMLMPKLRREVSISPSMMMEPWMGSDLNNQDLLDADSLLDHYQHKVIERKKVSNHELVVIESTPKNGAVVVWGALKQTVRSDGVPIQVDYFDQRGQLARTIIFSNPKQFDERTLPTRWYVIPQPGNGRYTELTIETLNFDKPLAQAKAFRSASDSRS